MYDSAINVHSPWMNQFLEKWIKTFQKLVPKHNGPESDLEPCVKSLRWSLLLKWQSLKAVNCFNKSLPLRCLAVFWIRLCLHIVKRFYNGRKACTVYSTTLSKQVSVVWKSKQTILFIYLLIYLYFESQRTSLKNSSA